MAYDLYLGLDHDVIIKYKYSTIKTEMGKLKTQGHPYCIKDNWENTLNLRHTLDGIYLTKNHTFNVFP